MDQVRCPSASGTDETRMWIPGHHFTFSKKVDLQDSKALIPIARHRMVSVLLACTLFLLLIPCCSQPYSVGGVPSGMEFVEIPSGTFLMGSPETELGRFSDEGPLHEVTIGYSFQMLSTEVTQSMWEEVAGTNPSAFIHPNRPVESVSWEDCQQFIEQLNELDTEYHYRLPSESEWEYACRAGTETRFYSGDEDEDLEEIGWFWGNSGATTEECRQKEPNGWGLYDMSGNVWEWCEDNYHEDYSGSPIDGSPWLEGSSPSRVSRGGSCGSAARRCRSAARDECYAGFRYYYLGFRVVRTLR